MPLTFEEAEEQAEQLHRTHLSERDRLDRVRRYWKGLQRLPAVIPRSAPREVREMARIARVNVCDIVIGSLAQSLFVDGFRPTTDSGLTADDDLGPWGVWQANRMDRDQTGVHRAALAYGTSYVLVEMDGDFLNMRGLSPRLIHVMYHPADPDWPVWALERLDVDLWQMYDDEAIYYLEMTTDNRFQTFDLREHGMGVTPVVRFVDEVDLDADDDVDAAFGHPHDDLILGQVSPLMPLQDQIDLTTFNLLVSQHYQAFKQRYILGWLADSEQKKVEASASRLWTFKDHPDDVEVGELSETSLDGYIKSREASLRHAASLSQTPAHELIGELVNLSAEALAAAEAGRDRKVDERKTSFGESWEQVFQLVGVLTGDEVPDDSQVVWRDTSARSFAATVDGLQKLKDVGVPVEMLLEMIPGWTQQDVERARTLVEGGDPLTFFTEVVQAQMSNGDEVPVG